jgi:protein-S-isoprenylcysteine O-methyltransferase Ste14
MKTILFYVLSLCTGLVIFWGLPLLGWGIREIPSFFDSPARLTYTIVILLLQIFGILYNPQVGRNKEDRKSGVKKHKIDLFLIQIFSISIVLVAPFSDNHLTGVLDISETIRFLGFIFVIPGFILMQMAEKYLDIQFSIEVTIQKNHKLIQDGPYKFIRHPRYLGIITFFMGISIVFRSLLSIFLVIALCIVLIWRVYTEESLMHQEFGTEWEIYCKKSWRMIPFVF